MTTSQLLFPGNKPKKFEVYWLSDFQGRLQIDEQSFCELLIRRK